MRLKISYRFLEFLYLGRCNGLTKPFVLSLWTNIIGLTLSLFLGNLEKVGCRVLGYQNVLLEVKKKKKKKSL